MSSSPGFWDTVRSWADSVGILSPDAARPGEKPHVPEAVCANCPICQGAATVDQLDHDAIADYVDLARNVVLGLGSALASAAEQRIQGESVESASLSDAPERESEGTQPTKATGNTEPTRSTKATAPTDATDPAAPRAPRRVKRKPRVQPAEPADTEQS